MQTALARLLGHQPAYDDSKDAFCRPALMMSAPSALRFTPVVPM